MHRQLASAPLFKFGKEWQSGEEWNQAMTFIDTALLPRLHPPNPRPSTLPPKPAGLDPGPWTPSTRTSLSNPVALDTRPARPALCRCASLQVQRPPLPDHHSQRPLALASGGGGQAPGPARASGLKGGAR
eukprot:323875-Rhodomonas_salina.1